MQIMNRYAKPLLATLISLPLLTACGGGDDDDDNGEATSANQKSLFMVLSH